VLKVQLSDGGDWQLLWCYRRTVVSLFVIEDLNSESYGEVEEKAEQRFNLIVGSGFEVIVSVGIRIDGNVVEDHFFARLKQFYQAENAAEAKGPK
jgi:hypothetical protein